MTMVCSKVREELVAYLDGEVDPDVREAIAAHLAGCPGCCEEMARDRKTWDILDAIGGVPEVDLLPPVRSRIGRFRRRVTIGSLAAAAALLLAVGVFALRQTERQSVVREAINNLEVLETMTELGAKPSDFEDYIPLEALENLDLIEDILEQGLALPENI